MKLAAKLLVETVDGQTGTTFVHYYNWPTGVIPTLPQAGDQWPLVGDFRRGTNVVLGEITKRTFFPEGILTREGLAYVEIEVQAVGDKDLQARLEKAGWQSEGS